MTYFVDWTEGVAKYTACWHSNQSTCYSCNIFKHPSGSQPEITYQLIHKVFGEQFITELVILEIIIFYFSTMTIDWTLNLGSASRRVNATFPVYSFIDLLLVVHKLTGVLCSQSQCIYSLFKAVCVLGVWPPPRTHSNDYVTDLDMAVLALTCWSLLVLALRLVTDVSSNANYQQHSSRQNKVRESYW